MANSIWQQEAGKVGAILEQIPAAKHRRALESFKASNPDHWSEALLTTLNIVSGEGCRRSRQRADFRRQTRRLKEVLARLISQHQASSDLLWLARERSDSFADILGPEVFRAMLTAMERDQFNEKRSNKLRDYILDDQTLLVELIGSADLEVIKDLTRALQLSPCLTTWTNGRCWRASSRATPPSKHDLRRSSPSRRPHSCGFLGKPGTPQERIR
jgi:hypothetical protein